MKIHVFALPSYSLPSAMIFSGLISASVLMASGGMIHAAVISWTETVVDSTDGDASPGTGLGDAAVSTNGALIEAANFGILDDFTVNGVLFGGIDFSVPPTNLIIGYDSADNFTTSTGTSTGGVIDNLSTSFGRDAGVSMHSATLTGLSIGQNYEVQFLSSFAGLGRTTTFDDGNGSTIVQTTNNPHSFSTGLFTADAVTQSVDMTASTGSQFLSAYQLRAVDAPPKFGPSLTIDRETGSMTLSTEIDRDMLGYSITSESGTLDQSSWIPITDNYDVSGNGLVDSDDTWTVLTGAGVSTDLSEAQLDGAGPRDGGTLLSAGPAVVLSSGGAWTQWHEEDVAMELLGPDGMSVMLPVLFVGNGDEAFTKGDLDFDGDIDADDHAMFATGLHSDLSSLSIFEAYALGDMNEDNMNNFDDFVLFRDIYDTANGVGAFAALQVIPVPEPSTIVLLLLGAQLMVCLTSRGRIHEFSPDISQTVGLTSKDRHSSIKTSVIHQLLQLNNLHFGRTFMKRQICLLPSVMLISGSIAVGGLMVSAGTVHAADIGWVETVVDSTDGDASPGTGLGDAAVSTNGTLVEAANFGTLVDYTVNGVLFNGIDFTVAPTNLSIGYDSADNIIDGQITGTSTGGTIDSLTTSFGRDTGVSIHSATLTGLTIGKNYEVQFLSSFAALNRSTTFDDGNGNTIVQSTNNPHSFATGAFTADAVTQSVDMTISSGSQFLSGYQLREIATPIFLDLLVDPASGLAKITNPTESAVNINYYEITSASSSLVPNEETGWNSLDDQNFDSVGPAAGESWTEAGGSNAGILSEFFTLGSTSLASSGELNLGKAFSIAGTQDLEFRYAGPGAISITTGTVTYGTIVNDGDFDNDGDVDGSDFLEWQRGGSPNPLSASDLADWKANYGSPLSGVAAAAIPEPSSLVLMLAVCGGLALTIRYRGRGASIVIAQQDTSLKKKTTLLGPVLFNSVAALIFVWAGAGSAALATVTNDREYWLGEDGLEGTSQGANIGSSNSPPLLAGDSADSKGPSGAFLDLTQSGNPTYQDVDATGGLNRPGANNGDFGARFDGVDDRLTAVPLNRPDELDTVLGGGYPLNYIGILGHGMQLWVYPDAAEIGSIAVPTTFQSIVADTVLSGGPAINEVGQWTQINGAHSDGSNGLDVIPATIDVTAGDTWYHVMHQNYPIASNTFLGVVYVDGVAVSANTHNISTGGLTNFVGQLVVGAAEVANNGIEPVYGNHFTGVVDDLEMYVFGDNTALGGQDYGTFDLFADNDWIANEIANTVPGGVLVPGDVDKDGDVDSGDVTAFVDGWLKEKSLPGAHGSALVGDWNTWDEGDMNHDGVTNLADAFILHEALAATELGGLDFGLLSRATVPEPSSIALIALTATAIFPIRLRLQKHNHITELR